MNWQDLNDQQKYLVLAAMCAYGGGFVSRLAEAWVHADVTNTARLEQAFPDMVERYGPGTIFYREPT